MCIQLGAADRQVAGSIVSDAQLHMRQVVKRHVEIVEVGPRDGLQHETVTFSLEAKQEFVGRMVAAGIRRLEVASFVNPKRVPQMADADALMKSLPTVAGVTYIGLVM